MDIRENLNAIIKEEIDKYMQNSMFHILANEQLTNEVVQDAVQQAQSIVETGSIEDANNVTGSDNQ